MTRELCSGGPVSRLRDLGRCASCFVYCAPRRTVSYSLCTRNLRSLVHAYVSLISLRARQIPSSHRTRDRVWRIDQVKVERELSAKEHLQKPLVSVFRATCPRHYPLFVYVECVVRNVKGRRSRDTHRVIEPATRERHGAPKYSVLFLRRSPDPLAGHRLPRETICSWCYIRIHLVETSTYRWRGTL